MSFRIVHRSTIAALLLFAALILSVRHSLSQDVTPEPPTSTETPTLELPTLTATASETPTETLMPTSSETATETVTATALTETATLTYSPTLTTTTTTATLDNINGALPVIYNDDFDTTAQSLWVFDVEPLLITGSIGRAMQFNTATPRQPLQLGGLGDVSLQAQILLNDGMVQFAIRNSGEGNYTAALYGDGRVELYRAEVLVQSGQTTLTGGQWHTLMFTALQNTASVVIDGVVALSYIDPAITCWDCVCRRQWFSARQSHT